MDLLAKSCQINKERLFNNDDLNSIDSFIFINGNKMKIRNNDVEYPFRQESNFFWLTGINKPDYQLAINCKKRKLIIIAPECDENYLVWHGKYPDYEKMKQNFGFDSIMTDNESQNLEYYDREKNQELLLKTIESLRIIKNEYEIELMKNACQLSQETHNFLIEKASSFIDKNERNVEANFKFLTESQDDITGQAYPPICACGENSAILHYNDNNCIMKKGELFLIDAGCEFLNYASDITRTYGIGEISKEKQKLIDIVTDINLQCKNKVRENTHFGEIHNKCMELVYQAIIDLKLVKDANNMTVDFLASIFMPHGLGHFIGLDVHDVGGRLFNKKTNESKLLKENMVITIEPGIYFNKYLLEKHKDLWTDEMDKYKDIGGVRIEDDIVVKKDGYQQLN